MRGNTVLHTVVAMVAVHRGPPIRRARRARPPLLESATGLVVGLAGLSFVGAGVWARRTAAATLARERIAVSGDESSNGLVRSAGAARSLAEVIRTNALAAADGRTYAETDAYLDPDGEPTPDADRALRDERTGQPVENPEHALWLQATTLETALMQAYMAFRLADLTIALGGTLVLSGAGLAAASRRT
jgi:hypothetical protein